MKELQDNELLEFLITSDFNEEYRPEEFKFLLHKFKYFYRILHGRNANIIGQKDWEVSSLNKEIETLKKTIQSTQIEKAELQNNIDLQPVVRKLTIMERILGRVDLKKINNKNETR